MEWSVDSTSDKKFVIVPDLLPHRLIKAMDNPPGSFSLDPYRDYRFSSTRLQEVLDNLHKAIYDRRQMHRLVRFLNIGVCSSGIPCNSIALQAP